MIYIWPDGDWCWKSAYGEMGYTKSDDFQMVQVPDWCDDNDAEEVAHMVHINGFVSPEQVEYYFCTQ